MRIATLEEIQMAIVSDIAAHLGGIGVIRLAIVSPWLKRHAHDSHGKIPLLLNFLRKLVISGRLDCQNRLAVRIRKR